MHTTIIGLDLAKNVFQLHAEDASGEVLWKKRLRREELEPYLRKQPPALIGMEACGSAHHWARVISARWKPRKVRLMHAKYVKAYVKRGKSDVRDAEAICEAVQRTNMRFVPIKSVEQQIDRSLERARELLVKQRTQLMNAGTRSLAGRTRCRRARGPGRLPRRQFADKDRCLRRCRHPRAVADHVR